MLVVNTSNPKIVQALLQLCDAMGVEAYAMKDEVASTRAKLLSEIERIKNGDTEDFISFADTGELADFLGVNWTPINEHSDKS